MYTNSIISYFDKKAKKYQSFFEKWPFNIIRKSEAKAVFSLLGNIKNQVILEPGCGSGFYTRLLLKHSVKHVLAIDLSSEMLNNLPSGPITTLKEDAATMKLHEKYSLILSCGMLEFTKNPIKILKNLHSHANHNCNMVLLLPRKNIFGFFYKLFHKKHKVNLKLFSNKKIKQLATISNWKIIDIKKCGLFSIAVKCIKD